MKEKIIKLLEENTQVRQLTCGEMLELIDRDDFEEIAQEIVKLFAIPVVSVSTPLQDDIELEARQSAEELPEHTAKERYYYKVGFNRGANFAIRTSVYSR